MDQKDKYILLFQDPILGVGSQGSIIRCKQKFSQNQNEFYAAKMIQKYSEEDDDNRFQNKLTMNEKKVIQELCKVSNKNLIHIHEVYEDLKFIYIIMDICDLGDLQKEIKKREKNNERFTAEQIIDFIFQIIEGFQSIYVNKIIHRDLKPDNIFLKNENGKTIYVIGDFGISRIVENYNQRGQYTRVFTKCYQSPQQFFKSSYSGKTDIFSFGLVLYELIHFRLPYDSESQKAFHEQLLSQKKLPFNIDFIEGSVEDKKYITDILAQTLTYDENDRTDWRKLKQSKEMYLRTSFNDKKQIELEKSLQIISSRDTTFRHLLSFFMSNFELAFLISENFNNLNTLNYFKVSEINQRSFNMAIRYFQYLNLNSIGSIYYQKYRQFSLKNKISGEEFEFESNQFFCNFNDFDWQEFSRWHHLMGQFKNIKDEIDKLVQVFNGHKIKIYCIAKFLEFIENKKNDYSQSLEFIEIFQQQLIMKQFKISSEDLTQCSESLLNFLYLTYQVKELKNRNIDLVSLKSKIYNLDQNNVVSYLLDQQQLIELKNQ